MGGRVVMYEALSNPESVSSLVVVDVTPNQERSKAMPSSGGISRYLNLLNETTVPSTIPENQIRRYIDEQMAHNVPEAGVRNFLLTNLMLTKDDERFRWKANVEVLLRDFSSLAAFPDFEHTEYLGDTLFIAGSKSPYIDWNRDYERINDLFPFANLETLETGHWVHAEKPREFVQICADFLNSQRK